MSDYTLKQFISLVVERKIRETDITGGKRVPHGSTEHIADLEHRIADMTSWRDRSKKGTEDRANYARIVRKLKAQLASARRAAEKAVK